MDIAWRITIGAVALLVFVGLVLAVVRRKWRTPSTPPPPPVDVPADDPALRVLFEGNDRGQTVPPDMADQPPQAPKIEAVSRERAWSKLGRPSILPDFWIAALLYTYVDDAEAVPWDDIASARYAGMLARMELLIVDLDAANPAHPGSYRELELLIARLEKGWIPVADLDRARRIARRAEVLESARRLAGRKPNARYGEEIRRGESTLTGIRLDDDLESLRALLRRAEMTMEDLDSTVGLSEDRLRELRRASCVAQAAELLKKVRKSVVGSAIQGYSLEYDFSSFEKYCKAYGVRYLEDLDLRDDELSRLRQVILLAKAKRNLIDARAGEADSASVLWLRQLQGRGDISHEVLGTTDAELRALHGRAVIATVEREAAEQPWIDGRLYIVIDEVLRYRIKPKYLGLGLLTLMIRLRSSVRIYLPDVQQRAAEGSIAHQDVVRAHIAEEIAPVPSLPSSGESGETRL